MFLYKAFKTDQTLGSDTMIQYSTIGTCLKNEHFCVNIFTAKAHHAEYSEKSLTFTIYSMQHSIKIYRFPLKPITISQFSYLLITFPAYSAEKGITSSVSLLHSSFLSKEAASETRRQTNRRKRNQHALIVCGSEVGTRTPPFSPPSHMR